MIAAAKPGTAKPGSALRALRLEKGWTLADVSRRTALPISTLSKVENGKLSLSYDKLARISKGLEIDIGMLFAQDAAHQSPSLVTGRRSIARAGEGRSIETDTYDHLYPATELLNKRFIPIIAEVRARSLGDFNEMIRHAGEEYAYVLEGCVELHTDLYAPIRLEKGDSIYFDSGMGHAYVAIGPTCCRILSICSGPESQIIAAIDKGGRNPAKPAAHAEPPVPIRRAARRRAGSS